MTSELYNSEHH